MQDIIAPEQAYAAFLERFRSELEEAREYARRAHHGLLEALYALNHHLFATDEDLRRSAAGEVCVGIECAKGTIDGTQRCLEGLERELAHPGEVGREPIRVHASMESAPRSRAEREPGGPRSSS